MNKLLLCASTALLLSGCQFEQNAGGNVSAVNDDSDISSFEIVKQLDINLNTGNTAMLIIDSQKAYVVDSDEFWVSMYYPDSVFPIQNKDPDLSNQIVRISQLAQKANELSLSTSITFEGFEGEASPYIDVINDELPSNSQRFYKTYFNSTKEPDIHTAMQTWLDQGITQIIVAGAETDVCVIQTISGLKNMGFDVILASDAAFSTEIHVKPALKRLQQMGVKLAKTAEILDSLDGDTQLTLSPRYNFKSLALENQTNVYQGDRYDMAVVSFNFDAQSIKLAEHDQKEAVLQRTKQWANDNFYLYETAVGMPNFHVSANNSPYSAELAKTDNLYQIDSVSYVIDKMQSQQKSQAIISGVFDEQELLTTVTAFIDADITPILLEDNILGRDVDLISIFDQAYHLGAVPSTYKSTSYEITASILGLDMSEAELTAFYAMLDTGHEQIPLELLPAIR
jgi:nicotinamidase-related amidase